MEVMYARTLLCLLFFSCTLFLQNQAFAAKKSYVVYLGGHSTNSNEETIVSSHHDLLASVMQSKERAKDAIFYSYTKAINGFAAVMEEDEAKEISKNPKVLSVFENKAKMLYTTHSWDFVGLPQNISASSLLPNANASSDVVIAHLDSGVWPESKSFRDDGMGPIPTKWKGICQNKNITNFSCNKKLIGARYYYAGFLSAGGSINDTKVGPRDELGHGTHTLSTSGGAMVTNASFFGYANGTLRGGSPHARVAMYRVCWMSGTCYDADILAAFDGAISDGVDLISLSLGGEPRPYFEDSIAIGSFHAIEKGIIVICAAGNSGPGSASVTNTAPWIFTVAAGTTDREFPSYLHYNGKAINGMSFAPRLPTDNPYPIISSTDASSDGNDICEPNTLLPDTVKGKIVACNLDIVSTFDQVSEVERAGGIGVVLVNDKISGDGLFGYPFNISTINISYDDGEDLNEYLASNKSAMAHISCELTTFGNKPAPQIADFSSRGPNSINEEILKPDIMAPGVDILASYSEAASPSGDSSDPLRTPYALLSGTSMATPHVSGLAGLLKALNPTWSPAMIKSAIMTTATIQDNNGSVITDAASMDPGTPFGYGAGQIHGRNSMDPGLVYDLTPQDYVNFLCALGYNSTEMKMFIGQYKCPSTPINIEDLNYPSITIPKLSGTVRVNRTLTNVGHPGTYKVSYSAPKGTSVKVSPSELDFDKVGDTKDFQVVITAINQTEKDYMFGMITWSHGMHSVNSPLAVMMHQD